MIGISVGLLKCLKASGETPETRGTILTSTNRPTETVRALDVSDPRNPKTLQEFKGVTSLLPDGGHGLIYLTNNEGLWILRYRRPSLMEPAKKEVHATPNRRSRQCLRIVAKRPPYLSGT